MPSAERSARRGSGMPGISRKNRALTGVSLLDMSNLRNRDAPDRSLDRELGRKTGIAEADHAAIGDFRAWTLQRWEFSGEAGIAEADHAAILDFGRRRLHCRHGLFA